MDVSKMGYQRPVQNECPYCHKVGTSLHNIRMDANERMWDEFICHRHLGGCGATKVTEFPRHIAKQSTPKVLADLRDEDREFKNLPMRLRSPVKGRRIDAGLWQRPRKKRPWFYLDG